MSKLTQIQQELRAVDQAVFQQICDTLLHAKGYDRITQIGTVLGANKVASGTPDTRFALPDGRYVFAEYTTQQTGVFAKLLGDLAKCFDEAKAGVPASRIRTVILCHNAKLETADEARLIDECRGRGVECLVFGPSDISLDLYNHHRALARDFLGVEIDTGQVLGQAEFVREYNKSAVAPPIDTAFRFRAKEVDEALAGLERSPILIVAGKAGVGKTRFALECAERFVAAHPATAVRVVYNRGANIFDDVRAYFGPPGHYLILVDDANRLAGLEHVLQVLRTAGSDRSVKVIATVRDYAMEKVIDAAKPYGEHAFAGLGPFSNEQVRELAREGCGIRNHLFLDRIATIAKGNPRLAVMAARAAEGEQSFEGIRDASGLYDAYFGSIRNDLDALKSDSVLTAAGIIAFFRVVDRSNVEMMEIIGKEFGVAAAPFWEAVARLHGLELVDIHDDDVVRISDQVLASYLFYLVFFKRRLLPLATLLGGLFPRFRGRLMDALNPVAETFPSDTLVEEIRTHVARAWQAFSGSGDEQAMLHLLDAFGPLQQTEALLFAKGQIDRMAAEPMAGATLDIRGNPDVTVPSPSVLSILQSFRSADEGDVRMALGLLCDYVAKKPAERKRVIHILSESFGMDTYSYLRQYARERAVIETLVARAKGGDDALFSGVFLATAGAYLHTEFRRTKAEGRNAIMMQMFAVPLTPELEALRRDIWLAVFGLFDHPEHQGAVLVMLAEHGRPMHMFGGSDGVATDAKTLLEFVARRLDPSNYTHCAAAQEYLDALDRRRVDYDAVLRQRFRSETLSWAEILTGNRLDRGADWQAQHTAWLDGIRALVAGYDAAAYGRFLAGCVEIRAAERKGRPGYPFETAVSNALLAAASRDHTVFVSVMRQYLLDGNPFGIGPWDLVPALIESMGQSAAFEMLSSGDYKGNRAWRMAFLRALPKEQVGVKHLEAIYTLYGEMETQELPHDVGHLGKYADVDPAVTHRVASILTRRAEEEPAIATGLAAFFEHRYRAGSAEAFNALLAEDPALMRRAYFIYLANDAHADHAGTVFEAFLDNDPDFADAYVGWIVGRAATPRWVGQEREYDFLWKRGDYAEVLGDMVERTHDWIRNRGVYWGPYPERFFLTDGRDETADADVRARQDEVLGGLLRKRGSDEAFVRAMFAIIANFSTARRVAHVRTLVEANPSFELFRGLQLQPSHMSWSGSKVPMLKERAAFWRSVRPVVTGLDFLGHRKFVEEGLQRACDEIERAKRAEFMDD